MFVTRRRLRAEQHRCADAINSAIDWKQRYDDSTTVSMARCVIIDALLRRSGIARNDIELLSDEMRTAPGQTPEIMEIASNELLRMAHMALGDNQRVAGSDLER